MIARVVEQKLVWVLLAVVAGALAMMALVKVNEQTASGAVTGGVGTAGYYIKFEGIDGEATDREHPGWSDLVSFDQGIRAPVVTSDLTTARRRGDLVLEDIVVAKEIDKASPKLAEAVATGLIFPKVEIHVTSSYSDGSRATYYTIELKNVLVTSYSVGGSSGVDAAPMENFSLNFEEIKVVYTEMDSAGRKKGNVEYSWKVAEVAAQ